MLVDSQKSEGSNNRDVHIARRKARGKSVKSFEKRIKFGTTWGDSKDKNQTITIINILFWCSRILASLFGDTSESRQGPVGDVKVLLLSDFHRQYLKVAHYLSKRLQNYTASVTETCMKLHGYSMTEIYSIWNHFMICINFLAIPKTQANFKV